MYWSLESRDQTAVGKNFLSALMVGTGLCELYIIIGKWGLRDEKIFAYFGYYLIHAAMEEDAVWLRNVLH